MSVSVYSQSDVAGGTVVYIQDDLEATSDDFEFVLYDIANVMSPQRAEVVVKPRLARQKSSLRGVFDQPVNIGLDLLDASQLKVEYFQLH